jgi:hypothetical protein
MCDVLRGILNQRLTEVGEAAPEFLMALATGQMRLSPAHLSALVLDFADASDDESWRFLWSQIEHSSDD